MNSIAHNQSLEKIEKAYSSEPWWYDLRGFFILTFAYRSTLWNQISLFSKNMGENHLEVAIGSGTLFDMVLKWRKLLSKPNSQITAFDYSPRMLSGAIKRFKKVNTIDLQLADVTKMKFPSDHYETVNVANSLHCFPDLPAAIKEIHRVLKPEGTFCGNVLLYPKQSSFLNRLSTRINNWGMKKGILHSPYREDQIVSLLELSGFKIVYRKTGGNCFDFIAKK